MSIYEEMVNMRQTTHVGTGPRRAEEEQRRDSDLQCNLREEAARVKAPRFGSRL